MFGRHSFSAVTCLPQLDMLLVEADKKSPDCFGLLDVHLVSSPIDRASFLYLSNPTSPFYRTDKISLLTSLCSLTNALVFGKRAGFTLFLVWLSTPVAMGKPMTLRLVKSPLRRGISKNSWQ